MTRRHRLLPCLVPPPATLSCASSCMCHDAAGITCLVLGCNSAFLVCRHWHWLLPSLSHSPSACCCACGTMLCQHLPRLTPGHDVMSCDSCPLRASSCVWHNAAGLPLRGLGNEVSLLLFVRFFLCLTLLRHDAALSLSHHSEPCSGTHFSLPWSGTRPLPCLVLAHDTT